MNNNRSVITKYTQQTPQKRSGHFSWGGGGDRKHRHTELLIARGEKGAVTRGKVNHQIYTTQGHEGHNI